MDHHAAPGSLLRSFERHLRARNRSERTIGNYLESARLAESFLEGCGKQLEEAARADLEDFLGCILRRRSANTAATRYQMLRVLYRWLEEKEELPNPMARMKPPIVPEQPVPTVLVACRTVALGGRLAALAGTSPIPASSGRVTRHQLNRRGDRQLNTALHTIAVVRLRDDPLIRAYAQPGTL